MALKLCFLQVTHEGKLHLMVKTSQRTLPVLKSLKYHNPDKLKQDHVPNMAVLQDLWDHRHRGFPPDCPTQVDRSHHLYESVGLSLFMVKGHLEILSLQGGPPLLAEPKVYVSREVCGSTASSLTGVCGNPSC